MVGGGRGTQPQLPLTRPQLQLAQLQPPPARLLRRHTHCRPRCCQSQQPLSAPLTMARCSPPGSSWQASGHLQAVATTAAAQQHSMAAARHGCSGELSALALKVPAAAPSFHAVEHPLLINSGSQRQPSRIIAPPQTLRASMPHPTATSPHPLAGLADWPPSNHQNAFLRRAECKPAWPCPTQPPQTR